MMLSRGQTAAFGKLHARPRDGEECELTLVRAENGGWAAAPQGVAVACTGHKVLTPVQRQTLAALEGLPKSPAELSTILGISVDTSRKRLERMEEDGLLSRLLDGRYALPEESALGCRTWNGGSTRSRSGRSGDLTSVQSPRCPGVPPSQVSTLSGVSVLSPLSPHPFPR